MIIDAEHTIIGRLATKVAKEALGGQSVVVLNAEKALFSGNQATTVQKYQRLRGDIGTRHKGPYIQRRPDMFMKRVIRGMLPTSGARGREAYKRIRIYMGVPEEFKGKQTVKIDSTYTSLGTMKFTSVGEVCKELGWNQQ